MMAQHLPQAAITQMALGSSHQTQPLALRVGVCGSLWYRSTHFGEDVASLVALQTLLDARWPACLDTFEGDFVLCYLSPDFSCCSFYRGVTATYTLYYRLDRALLWSTNIAQLFPHGSPTLRDVDEEMIPILAATARPTPGRTCYRDLKSVPAGTGLCFYQDGRISSFEHDLTLREDNRRLPLLDAAHRFRELVRASLDRCFQGCSTANVLLSGGMDTAVVAYETACKIADVRAFHWTWDIPLFQDERACAELIARHLGVSLHTLDFQASINAGGNYLRSMQSLLQPYNHAFFHCFDQIAQAAAQDSPQVIAGGHLGDTAFQGDWADPFRASWSRDALRTIINLFSWYPRSQAMTVLLYLLFGKQKDYSSLPGQDRIEPASQWMTPQASKLIQEQGLFDDRQKFSRWKEASISTYMVRVNVQNALEGETDLDATLHTQVLLPRKLVRVHPFSDMALLEFCLSLGPEHRRVFLPGDQSPNT
jgi:hypothetical protein